MNKVGSGVAEEARGRCSSGIDRVAEVEGGPGRDGGAQWMPIPRGWRSEGPQQGQRCLPGVATFWSCVPTNLGALCPVMVLVVSTEAFTGHNVVM